MIPYRSKTRPEISPWVPMVEPDGNLWYHGDFGDESTSPGVVSNMQLWQKALLVWCKAQGCMWVWCCSRCDAWGPFDTAEGLDQYDHKESCYFRTEDLYLGEVRQILCGIEEHEYRVATPGGFTTLHCFGMFLCHKNHAPHKEIERAKVN